MIYIITEEQNKRLIKQIIKYLDDNLTPYIGWESTKEYKKGLKLNDNELFLHFTEDDDDYDDNHMWYSLHTNPNVSLKKEDCPIVLIPDPIANSLDGFFGEVWKPIFIQWFQKNTGLELKKVDNFGWDN